MIALLRRATGRMADWIWPRTCAVATCGRPSDRPDRHICSSCFAALPFLETGGECVRCGRPVPAPTRHDFVCESCQTDPPAFERARSALRYAFAAAELVQSFKYRRALQLTEDFGDLLEATLRAKFDTAAIDLVMPVPLHPHRLRERGFNQSELLAETLARRINRRLDTRSFIRRRDTEHQARSNGVARRANLHAAFAVRHPEFVRGRTALLVDDVMTTGATLSACAQTLRDGGAARVWCLTLARATLEG